MPRPGSLAYANGGGGVTIDIADSQLAGKVFDFTSAVNQGKNAPVVFSCVGDYNGSFVALSATCQ